LKGSGILVAIDDQSFAWVEDSPYRLTRFRLDGTARVSDVWTGDAEATGRIEGRPVDGASTAPARNRRGFATGGHVLLMRIYQNPAAAPDGSPAVRPEPVIDELDVESGRLISRTYQATAEIRGGLCGLRGRDDLALLHYLAGDGKPAFMTFAARE
jgi:hypothetical protein